MSNEATYLRILAAKERKKRKKHENAILAEVALPEPVWTHEYGFDHVFLTPKIAIEYRGPTRRRESRKK